MGDEDSQIWGGSKRRVLGEMTNTCAKRGHPLVPGKFLIGNDRIRKQEPAGAGPEGPAAGKRVIGELVNVSKGKQRFNWASESRAAVAGGARLPASARTPEDGRRRHSSPSASGKTSEAGVNARKRALTWASEADGAAAGGLHDGCRRRSSPTTASGASMDLEASDPARRTEKPSCSTTDHLPPQEAPRGSSITWAPFPMDLFGSKADVTGSTDRNREAAGQKHQLGLGDGSIEFVNLAEKMPQENEFVGSRPVSGDAEQHNSGAAGLPEELGNARSRFKPGSDVDGNRVAGKDCSCSLCLKAGYLWADLLYQDCKGRLMEVNRSRRDARVLTGISSSHDPGGRVAGNDDKSARLEADLRQLWRALFVHTESLLTCESAQLQSSLVKLKELRESCKRDAGVAAPSVFPSGS